MKKFLIPIIFILLLVGCGQQTPPSPTTIQRNAEFFQLTRPDGTKMWCASYGSGTILGQTSSKSWFSFTCDWGLAYHPEDAK